MGGCMRDRPIAIADRWGQHFKQLYNHTSDESNKNKFHNRLKVGLQQCESFVIRPTLDDIANALSKLKMGKAAGLDCIDGEAIKYACSRLHVHLCLLFNLFLKHGYVPSQFMHSVIIPLLKNKFGSLTDINNYRAIAISSVMSTLFEMLLLDSLSSSSD